MKKLAAWAIAMLLICVSALAVAEGSISTASNDGAVYDCYTWNDVMTHVPDIGGWHVDPSDEGGWNLTVVLDEAFVNRYQGKFSVTIGGSTQTIMLDDLVPGEPFVFTSRSLYPNVVMLSWYDWDDLLILHTTKGVMPVINFSAAFVLNDIQSADFPPVQDGGSFQPVPVEINLYNGTDSNPCCFWDILLHTERASEYSIHRMTENGDAEFEVVLFSTGEIECMYIGDDEAWNGYDYLDKLDEAEACLDFVAENLLQLEGEERPLIQSDWLWIANEDRDAVTLCRYIGEAETPVRPEQIKLNDDEIEYQLFLQKQEDGSYIGWHAYHPDIETWAPVTNVMEQ